MNGYLKLELDFFYLRCRASATQLLLLVRDGSRLKWMTRSEEEDPNTKIQDPKNPKKLQILKLQWATQTWP